jgi:hypothetical protein
MKSSMPESNKPLPFGEPDWEQEGTKAKDRIYDLCMAKAEAAAEKEMGTVFRCGRYSPTWATPWIHLADGVDRGTIEIWEAFESLKVGYLMEHLKVRGSRYQHLL